MRRFHEMKDPDERKGAAFDALRWGYPRELVDGELEASLWLRYGEDCVIWYNPCNENGDLAVHLCIAPEARGLIWCERMVTGGEVVAELLGAEKLYALKPLPGKIVKILDHLGWTQEELGYVRTLGDE